MLSFGEKAKTKKAGNLNQGSSYLCCYNCMWSTLENLGSVYPIKAMYWNSPNAAISPPTIFVNFVRKPHSSSSPSGFHVPKF